jgi:hypothetical protein
MHAMRMRAGAVAALAFAAFVHLAVLPACSRATEADCKLIVDRSVELEMKGASSGAAVDAAAVAQRSQQVRAELDEQIRACQGRRVTDKTMACVRAATTSEELDKCLK